MSLAVLAVFVTLATIPPVHGIVWAFIRVWRHVSRRSRSTVADADTLFFASIAPAAVAVALFVTLPAFVLFEPARRGERPGIVLALLAAVGAGYTLIVISRALSVTIAETVIGSCP